MNTAVLRNETQTKFIAQIANGWQGVDNSSRKGALAALDELDFPDRRSETWKYTRVARILAADYTHQASHSLMESEPNSIVFVNGVFNAELSTWNIQDEHIGLRNTSQPTAVNMSYGEGDIFLALNHAYPGEGIQIEIPKNVRVEEHVRIIHYSCGNSISQPHHHIVLHQGAELTLSMEYRSADQSICFTNAFTTVHIEANASLKMDKVMLENEHSFFIGQEEVVQYTDSRFHINTISFGNAIARNRMVLKSVGQHTDTQMYGVFMPTGDQHLDHSTIMDHTEPHCESNETYKGIAADNATGVFNGKVFVREDAQKTNAYQSNANILLSAASTINSKPELEIYADDVKCSHGSTTGQLNKDHLFYLKARGIGHDEAVKLLINAFAGEVIDQMFNDTLKEEALQLLAHKVASIRA